MTRLPRIGMRKALACIGVVGVMMWIPIAWEIHAKLARLDSGIRSLRQRIEAHRRELVVCNARNGKFPYPSDRIWEASQEGYALASDTWNEEAEFHREMIQVEVPMLAERLKSRRELRRKWFFLP